MSALNQTTTWQFNKYGSLEFTFTYGEMVIEYCIDEPYLTNWDAVIEEIIKVDIINLTTTEGEGKGDEQTVSITLPRCFTRPFIDALREAMKDKRMNEPVEDNDE